MIDYIIKKVLLTMVFSSSAAFYIFSLRLRFTPPDDIISGMEAKDQMLSMTGYGSGRAVDNGWEVTVDLKTVNHRFLDISTRLPKNIAFLDQTLRTVVTEGLRRGHVDVFVTVRNPMCSAFSISPDVQLARQYSEAARRISEAAGIENDLTVSCLMGLEGVIIRTDSEMEQEPVAKACEAAARAALNQVIAMRSAEGIHLREDILKNLQEAERLREKILSRAPLVVDDYRKRLEQRIRTIAEEEPDPARLAQEVAIMADRCAIDEELSRLSSHFARTREFLDAEGETGKKIDFIIQEMNRETNTIGSKASDAMIAHWVVDLKSVIEKMREQIQNVE